MKISIDTDTKVVEIDGKIYSENLCGLQINDTQIPIKPANTLASELAKYRGVHEYEGIVADIQKWYYGKIIESPWCATCVSYFANKVGILSQLGGKNANVYDMMISCLNASPYQFYTKDSLPQKILKDDILFMLWEGEIMNRSSSKHVTVCEYSTSSDTIFCIGGNQKDKICTLEYERKNIYAMFRPRYNYGMDL